jgi:multicomponent Na+:H+ antiporter subunit A
LGWDGARFYDVILVGIIIVAALFVTRTRSRLATIALLGSIGYSIAILFLLYSAPDLAMTQFAVETLTVILFVLVIYRLPKFRQLSSRRRRLRDVTIAVLSGAMMTVLMLVVSWHGQDSQLADYFMQSSLSQAFGRNVVNVILVDFRGFDTLGEITVLAVAAIGVYALLRSERTHLIKGDGND